MTINKRKTVRDIIRINPMLGGLQSSIEKEQESVVADTVSPAAKVVQRLIELDNRRIDLCNLNVLYGFIERGLGDKFELLRACALADVNSDLYDTAERQVELAGYTLSRAEREFSYLFKRLKTKRGRRKIAKSMVDADGIVVCAGAV